MDVQVVGEEAAVGLASLGEAVIVRGFSSVGRRPPGGGKQEGDLDHVAESELSDAIRRGWRQRREG
jgi:hypothetical protein